MSAAQCPSQYGHAGCGLPAGHDGTHYSADRMSGWTDGCKSATRGPWTICGAAHPTAGVACGGVAGHKGEHCATLTPVPADAPLVLRAVPFVAWRPRKAASR